MCKKGHHESHHQRREQHQKQHSNESKQSPKQGDEGSMSLGVKDSSGTGTGLSGMKVREKVVEHTKGGMPMGSEG